MGFLFIVVVFFCLYLAISRSLEAAHKREETAEKKPPETK